MCPAAAAAVMHRFITVGEKLACSQHMYQPTVSARVVPVAIVTYHMVRYRTMQQDIIGYTDVHLVRLQCFDAVGWAAGRASSL